MAKGNPFGQESDAEQSMISSILLERKEAF